MSLLGEAFTLHPAGAGEWRGFADPGYEAGTGMFGGWTAAMLLRAALANESSAGTPSSLTVHYFKRVVPGSEVSIGARVIGGSRSLQFWQTELRLAGDDQVASMATIMLAQRRESEGFTEEAMPSVPEPDALPRLHPPSAFGQRTLVRPVGPGGLFDQPSSRTLGWVRETSGRAIDHAQLAYLCDSYAPRIYFKSQAPRPSSTITMSIYFLATQAQLVALGDDYVLLDVVGTRAEHSTIGSQARLWSRSGQLLATTEQLCWFK